MRDRLALALVVWLTGCGASTVSGPEPSAAVEEVPSGADSADGMEALGGGLRGLAVGPREHRPVVIALHGRGDHPARFMNVARTWADVAHVVVPAAMTPHSKGFSWFHIRARQDDPSLAAAVAEATRRVVQLVHSRRSAETPLVVTGFSQGGMLSFALATRPQPVVDGAVPMGGFLPRGLWPDSLPAEPAAIFAVHGEADTVITVDAPRATVAHLKALGWPVQLETTPDVAHTLTPGMLQRVDVELRAMLSP